MNEQQVDRRSFPTWLGVLLALGGGLLVACQARITGGLGQSIGNGFVAAFVSFASGLVLLLVVTALRPSLRRGVATYVGDLRHGRFPWYYAIAGLAGALYVLSQGLVAAVVGVALFTVSVVAGQTIGGMVMDAIGVGPGGRHPVTIWRALGAALTLVAVVLSVAPQLRGGVNIWPLILPLVAGMGQGWQQAINGRVTRHTGQPLVATLGNFTLGTLALLVVGVVVIARQGWPSGRWPTNPLMYTAGAIGCIYIALGAAIVKHLGVLLLGMSTVAGQVIGAVLLDIVLPAPGHHLAAMTVVGAALTLVAVGVAGMRPRSQ